MNQSGHTPTGEGVPVGLTQHQNDVDPFAGPAPIPAAPFPGTKPTPTAPVAPQAPSQDDLFGGMSAEEFNQAFSQPDTPINTLGVKVEDINEPLVGAPVTPEVNPEQQTPADTPPGVDPKNDPTRYQYWHSEAAKKEQRIAELEAKLEAQQTPSPQTPAEPEQRQYTLADFPPPPQAPPVPPGFSEQAAFEDPSGPSGVYMHNARIHQGQLQEYYQAKDQFRDQIIQTEVGAIREELAERDRRAQAHAEEQAGRAKLIQAAKAKGMNDEAAASFIDYFQNEQPTVNDLIDFFQFRQGQQPAAQNQVPPSPVFQQRVHASQLPPDSMSIPSRTPGAGEPVEKQLMESMVNYANGNNAFE